MKTLHYYEPLIPTLLAAPSLRAHIGGVEYQPHFIRLRKRRFSASMIEALDRPRHGHAHRIYHVIYYLEGASTIHIGDHELPIRAGQMAIINPDIRHNVMPGHARDCAFLTLMFDYRCGELITAQPLATLLETMTGRPCPLPTVVDDPGGLQPYVTCLEREVLQRREKDIHLVSYCLAGILNELSSITLRQSSPEPLPDDVLAIQSYLIKHLEETITIRDLMALTGLSRSRLIGKFRQHCDMTPIDFLINERIEKAKLLLLQSSKRVKTIAGLCGFESEYYFSKTFKKRTGHSPMALRRGGPHSDAHRD